MKTGWMGCALACLIPTSAMAATITIDATDRGWYDETGSHSPSNLNYIVGNDGSTYRNFFVFDLTGVTGTITSAQLRLFNPATGYSSGDASETYSVFDVGTGIASLTAGTGGVAAHTDLGSGTSYGSYVSTSADNNTFVLVDLNASAISALSLASGLFAFGGSITTLDGNSSTVERLFAFSSGGILANTQLILTTDVVPVPEPGTIALFGLGVAGLGFAVRRRRSAIRGRAPARA